jgi:hypothetical protein
MRFLTKRLVLCVLPSLNITDQSGSYKFWQLVSERAVWPGSTRSFREFTNALRLSFCISSFFSYCFATLISAVSFVAISCLAFMNISVRPFVR